MDPLFIGQISIFTGALVPRNWAACDGTLLNIDEYKRIYDVIGNTYGGDPNQNTFRLPDLKANVPVGEGRGPGLSDFPIGSVDGVENITLSLEQMASHNHAISGTLNFNNNPANETSPISLAVAPILMYSPDGPTPDSSFHPETISATAASTGSSTPEAFTNRDPYQGVTYIIAIAGVSPGVSEGLIGQVSMFANTGIPTDVPAGDWTICNGELMSIAANETLFSILGTTYGGDGRTTFALPDLRGRIPVGAGDGYGLNQVRLGEKGGAEKTRLSPANLPAHKHEVTASLHFAKEMAVDRSPSEASFAAISEQQIYQSDAPTEGAEMHPDTISGSSSHTGSGAHIYPFQPYLTINYVICLRGLLPVRR